MRAYNWPEDEGLRIWLQKGRSILDSLLRHCQLSVFVFWVMDGSSKRIISLHRATFLPRAVELKIKPSKQCSKCHIKLTKCKTNHSVIYCTQSVKFDLLYSRTWARAFRERDEPLIKGRRFYLKPASRIKELWILKDRFWVVYSICTHSHSRLACKYMITSKLQ